MANVSYVKDRILELCEMIVKQNDLEYIDAHEVKALASAYKSLAIAEGEERSRDFRDLMETSIYQELGENQLQNIPDRFNNL